MSKVAIIGNAGGGKSTLARRLGQALGLPVRSVDDVQFEADWQPASLDRVSRVHEEWLSEPKWVIDGWGHWELIERRFEMADTIVVVDFPMRIHYRWVLKRQLLALVGLSSGWPPQGCSAWGVTFRLLRVMRGVERELRPKLFALTSRPVLRERVVYIRSPRQLSSFLEGAIARSGV